MIQLPPSEFTYTRYDMVHLPWAVIGTTDAYYKHLLSLNIIGWCDSMECEIRPRPDDMAVMVEEDGGHQSWVHVPKDVWNEYIRRTI